MKFSEQWLREYVNPPLTTQELVDQLTMAGLEVDGFEPVAGAFTHVVVAEVVAVTPHPDADKLRVCRVNNGDEEVQIVCGAPNVRAGLKVPLAKLGATLEDFKIKKAKLRGVESFGMLCSERELGISDSHEGLMELPANAPVGADIRDYLSLDDVIIDLDLTPNRSDCLGLMGLARETGVINGLDTKSIDIPEVTPTIDDTFPVQLLAAEACPRFLGRVIRGINLGAETPAWMKEKLRRCDVRSIDPVVDVTNYVMLELGQPMHAYDLDKLTKSISVRMSESAETITLLGGQEIKLDAETLLISDESGPIGIAGIMGGLSTSVSATTSNILFEAAFFAPTSIAGRARSYGLNTDASHRFERGVDWAGQRRAMERATELLLSIAGGDAGPIVESVLEDKLPAASTITLRSARVSKMLGVAIEDASITEMLGRLGFHYSVSESSDGAHWAIEAPSHRFDIAIEADLIEEISRIYGYNNLPVRTPKVFLQMAPVEEAKLTTNKIKDQLVARGYQEAITYSFVDPKSQMIIDPANDAIALANPLSAEMSVMRTTLWSGLLKAASHNLNRQQSRIRLFETGMRFLQKVNEHELVMSNIQQEKVLAGIVCGPRLAENWIEREEPADFYDVKGDIESILALTGCAEQFSFIKGTHAALHPGQCAEIMRAGNSIGYLGLLDPRVQKQLDLQLPVYVFELRLALLEQRHQPSASPMSKFPEVRRDIAVIVDNTVTAGEIQACVRLHSPDSLTNLKLFDVYQGKGIDPNRKSIALGLTFQHVSRTLTDEEINATVEAVVAGLRSELDASLRD